MRIAVYGATGMIGGELVSEAVMRGHRVTALSRSVDGFTSGVVAVTGDMVDLAHVAAVGNANDVVVSAMGPSRTSAEERETWPQRLRDFAYAVGSARLVVVGGAGTLIVAPGVRFLDSPAFMEEYRAESTAVAEGFHELQSLREEVSWTFICPPFEIGPGDRTGNYRRGLDAPAGHAISTQDFAIALLDEIEDPKHVRTRFTVAN